MDDDPKAKIYRCCDPCEDMLRLLGDNDIEIEDLWDKSEMMVPNSKCLDATYHSSKLKPVQTILVEFLKR